MKRMYVRVYVCIYEVCKASYPNLYMQTTIQFV